MAFAAVVALAVRLIVTLPPRGAVTIWNGFLRVDALSALVIALTSFVALVSSIYAVGYFQRDELEGRITARQLHIYYILTPVFVAAMLLAPMADNLGVMWVAIESTTLASVLLVAFYNQKTSFEAAWKYIMIGSVGISLALFGTVITYYSGANAFGPDTHGSMNWSELMKVAPKLDQRAMRLAFILVLIGYGTKAGLVPMHTWKPDAYSEAPIPSATLLGAGFINCAIYGIIRFDALAEPCLGHALPRKLLTGFGVGSILIAACFIIAQRNFRRILAYSSIDHAGIMAAALGFGGKLGAFGLALHMLFHAVTKPLLFFAVGNVQQHYQTPFFRKVRGAIKTLPWTAVLLLLGTFAVTGVPPFSIFQSEFVILSAGIAAGNSATTLIFIAGVVAVFCGFLSHMAKMNLGEPRDDAPGPARECPWKLTAMVLVTAAMVLLAFWMPASLHNLIESAAQTIGGIQ